MVCVCVNCDMMNTLVFS